MKTNKILSVILAIAMIMSTMGFNVFADDKYAAYIGQTGYATLEEALKAASESSSETVITLAEGEIEAKNVEGKIVLPETLCNVTIKGAKNGSVLKNLAIVQHESTWTQPLNTFENVTFDGITFDNSRIYIVNYKEGTILKNWTINNCVFTNFTTKGAGGLVQLDLSSKDQISEWTNQPCADTALENFTFTNNIVDGAMTSDGITSALNLRALEGTINISNNIFSNIAYNAIQTQYVDADATYNISNNIINSLGSNAINLNECKSSVSINNNNITVKDSMLYVINISGPITATGNSWAVEGQEELLSDSAAAELCHYADKDVVVTVESSLTTVNTPYSVTSKTTGNTYAVATLKAALALAQAGDTVTIGEDIDKLPEIDKPLTLVGADADGNKITVSQTNGEHPFGASINGTVTFKNFVFENGTKAFRVENNYTNVTDDYTNLNLVIDNCEFNNVSDYAIMGGKSSTDGEVVLGGLKVTNCEFTTTDAFNSYVIWAQRTKNIEISDNEINGINDAKGAIHLGDGLPENEATSAAIKNNTITGFKRGIVTAVNQSKGTATIDGNTFEDISEGAVYLHENIKGLTTELTVINNTATNSQFVYNESAVETDGLIKTYSNNTVDGEDVALDDATKIGGTFAASVNGLKYTSLKDALDAASDGNTVKLLSDATISEPTAFTKELTLDLNGKTLNMTAEVPEVAFSNNDYSTAYYVGAPLTFKNGSINVSSQIKQEMDHGIFYVQNNGAALIFDNVELVSNGFSSYSLFHSYGKVNLKDSVVDVKGTAKSERFAYSEDYDQFTLDNSVVTATGLTWYGSEYVEFNVTNNSKLTLDGAKADIHLGDMGSIKAADKLPKVDSTSTLNAEVYIKPATDGSNLADKVKLSYEATDKQNVYNMYIEAAEEGKTINRLSAVQLKFELEAKSDAAGNVPEMSYSIAPAKNVQITGAIDDDDDPNDTTIEDLYVFNFTGENNVADKSGAKIQIGTVTFGGYGEFEFNVVDSAGNYVAKVKTAELADNIVAEYVPASCISDAAKQGEFVTDSSKLSAKVEEVKREVKVVIAFNNNLDDEINSAAYNNMTVTLTGSNGKTYSAQVGDKIAGSDAVNYNAEKAELVFNVEANYRYTVTVTGAGYRTARYTTIVNEGDDALVLNFWNNALEDENRNPRTQEIEAGKKTSAKDVTFLAGDISPDNIIDKYDLAAVVSYFGYDGLKDDINKYGYAKYDLNRDGIIDADDISWVLVSWGK